MNDYTTSEKTVDRRILFILICTLAVVLGFAVAMPAQVTAPNPIIGGSAPPVSIPGHEPGETVTLAVYYDEAALGGAEPDATYEGTADANGEAHFRPPIPGGLDMVGFSDGPTQMWNEIVVRHVIPPSWVVRSALFFLLGVLLDNEGTGEAVYLVQHVLTGETFFLFEGSDGFEVIYP